MPGLGAAILANGLAIHPYGALGESVEDDTGVAAGATEEGVAHTVLGATPPVYVTEFGYDLRQCHANVGACSGREQASKLKAAYAAFLADPHVEGIWWYQSHDDSIGHYGLMTNRNRRRPSFKALSAIAEAEGQ